MKLTKISVVMSVYNGEAYLNEAIDSILNQTFRDFEFIIINDGSTDNSLEIIKSYKDDRIVLIDQENTGQAVARNNAIKFSKGKYIAILDADDISMPNRLQLQYEFLETHPECVAVGSNAEIIDKDGNYVFTSNQLLTWEEIKKQLPQMPFFHSSTMFRKSAFENVGGYPEILRLSQDVVFLNNLAKIGQLINLKHILIKYRLHPGAVTTKSSKKDSKVINEIVLDAINGKITDEQINILKSIAINKSAKEKNAIYHLHLAKKYLWNNYQPRLARRNLLKSMKIKFNFLSIVYLLISFLPERVIKKVYKNLK